MPTVFFSYSHADEALRDQLETQLAMLQRQGVIHAWHDRRIGAGENFAQAIDAHINTAQAWAGLRAPFASFLIEQIRFRLRGHAALPLQDRVFQRNRPASDITLQASQTIPATFARLM
jgi:hypothetical protein